MDDRLKKRLLKIEEQIDILKGAESLFLQLEAHRKVLFSQLFLKAMGKSVAEKEALAYASDEWIDFSKGHAEAESALNHERRWYELRMKAFDSEYITFKLEAPAIKRSGGL